MRAEFADILLRAWADRTGGEGNKTGGKSCLPFSDADSGEAKEQEDQSDTPAPDADSGSTAAKIV